MFTLSLEGFRPRPPFMSVPVFSASDLCGLRVSAFGSLSSLCSGGSSDPCSSLIPDSFDASIPFRITSFAAPHHVTLIESHLCKNRGGGTHRGSTQTLPIFSTASKHAERRNPRISTLFNRLLHGSLDTQGWGIPPRPSSTTHHSLFTTHQSAHNFYPPAPDLRHNPAAQGHTSVPLNQRAHSSSQTGRIQ
jgi:hypothetical protein